MKVKILNINNSNKILYLGLNLFSNEGDLESFLEKHHLSKKYSLNQAEANYLEKLKNTENPTALPHKKSDCKHYKSSLYHGLVFYSWIMEDYKIDGVEMYESGEIIIRLITKMTQKEIQERYFKILDTIYTT